MAYMALTTIYPFLYSLYWFIKMNQRECIVCRPGSLFSHQSVGKCMGIAESFSRRWPRALFSFDLGLYWLVFFSKKWPIIFRARECNALIVTSIHVGQHKEVCPSHDSLIYAIYKRPPLVAIISSNLLHIAFEQHLMATAANSVPHPTLISVSRRSSRSLYIYLTSFQYRLILLCECSMRSSAYCSLSIKHHIGLLISKRSQSRFMIFPLSDLIRYSGNSQPLAVSPLSPTFLATHWLPTLALIFQLSLLWSQERYAFYHLEIIFCLRPVYL